MENLSTNKKIGLACGIGLLISFFLPYVSVMGLSISLMDATETEALLWIFPLCGAAAAFFTFKDNVSMARIAFLIALGYFVYGTFLKSGGAGMDFFSVAGIGGYLLVASAIAGVVFSKE